MLVYALVAGVLFGLYFSLVGIGLNLVFGVMRIVNLAHGDILMLGAFIALGVLEKCFASELTQSGWLPKLKEIIPTYGIDLAQDADACRKTRADTAAILKVENI